MNDKKGFEKRIFHLQVSITKKAIAKFSTKCKLFFEKMLKKSIFILPYFYFQMEERILGLSSLDRETF